MIKLNVIDRAGVAREIVVAERQTLMEALRGNGFDELVAMCGGSCSCATCHVYVAMSDGELPSISDDESDLLDSSDLRMSDSRLACQVRVDQIHEGVIITIAPED